MIICRKATCAGFYVLAVRSANGDITLRLISEPEAGCRYPFDLRNICIVRVLYW